MAFGPGIDPISFEQAFQNRDSPADELPSASILKDPYFRWPLKGFQNKINSETSDSSFYESVIGESRYNDQHVPFYISLDRMIKQYPELFSQKEKEKLEEPDHDIFLSLDESQSDAISSTASKMFNLTNSMVNSLLDPESKQSAGSNALVIQAALQSGVSRSIINQALRRLDQLKNRINETPDEDTMLVDNSDDDSTPT